jgi:hypothetical protein
MPRIERTRWPARRDRGRITEFPAMALEAVVARGVRRVPRDDRRRSAR